MPQDKYKAEFTSEDSIKYKAVREAVIDSNAIEQPDGTYYPVHFEEHEEITLCHVLIAIGELLSQDDKLEDEMYLDKDCLDIHINRDVKTGCGCCHETKEIGFMKWSLHNNTLEAQSAECIDWLHKLLCK